MRQKDDIIGVEIYKAQKRIKVEKNIKKIRLRSY